MPSCKIASPFAHVKHLFFHKCVVSTTQNTHFWMLSGRYRDYQPARILFLLICAHSETELSSTRYALFATSYNYASEKSLFHLRQMATYKTGPRLVCAGSYIFFEIALSCGWNTHFWEHHWPLLPTCLLSIRTHRCIRKKTCTTSAAVCEFSSPMNNWILNDLKSTRLVYAKCHVLKKLVFRLGKTPTFQRLSQM